MQPVNSAQHDNNPAEKEQSSPEETFETGLAATGSGLDTPPTDRKNVVARLTVSDPPSQQRLINGLQRKRGNAYVQRVLADYRANDERQSAVQRTPGNVIQRDVGATGSNFKFKPKVKWEINKEVGWIKIKDLAFTNEVSVDVSSASPSAPDAKARVGASVSWEPDKGLTPAIQGEIEAKIKTDTGLDKIDPKVKFSSELSTKEIKGAIDLGGTIAKAVSFGVKFQAGIDFKKLKSAEGIEGLSKQLAELDPFKSIFYVTVDKALAVEWDSGGYHFKVQCQKPGMELTLVPNYVAMAEEAAKELLVQLSSEALLSAAGALAAPAAFAFVAGAAFFTLGQEVKWEQKALTDTVDMRNAATAYAQVMAGKKPKADLTARVSQAIAQANADKQKIAESKGLTPEEYTDVVSGGGQEKYTEIRSKFLSSAVSQYKEQLHKTIMTWRDQHSVAAFLRGPASWQFESIDKQIDGVAAGS